MLSSCRPAAQGHVHSQAHGPRSPRVLQQRGRAPPAGRAEAPVWRAGRERRHVSPASVNAHIAPAVRLMRRPRLALMMLSFTMLLLFVLLFVSCLQAPASGYHSPAACGGAAAAPLHRPHPAAEHHQQTQPPGPGKENSARSTLTSGQSLCSRVCGRVTPLASSGNSPVHKRHFAFITCLRVAPFMGACF